jgi:hypothetical protein
MNNFPFYPSIHFITLRSIKHSGRTGFLFFSIFFVVLGFSHDSATMESSDVLVEIPHRQSLWCNRYSEDIKNIPDIAGLQKLRESLKTKQCLPSDASPLEQLLYLSTISKEGDNSKTLFTCAQQKKFDRAEGIKRWVGRCFWINGAIITIASGFPFVSAISFLQCVNGTLHDCLSSASTVLTPGAVAWFGSMAIGFSSLYATGISPDLSARNADKVQDLLSDLHHHYSTIAKYWIDMYFSSPEKATCLAHMFDIEELKNRAKIKTCKNKIGDNLVSSLEEACHFIRTGNVLPKLTVIENYIRNEVNRKQIESLEKIIKNTQQMKRKKHGKR